MDCSQNDFCKQLPDKSRLKLCPSCRKSFFKANSIQTREDYLQSCMLILDGCLTSTTDLDSASINHDVDVPSLYLAMPGRLLNLDITFKLYRIQTDLTYADFYYLTDSWVASFNHDIIQDLCDNDPDFRHVTMRNMVQISADACVITALFRSNYTYLGIYHLIDILTKHDQYLSQQQLAKLMNRDRASISKAISRLKSEHPEKWEAYAKNKARIVSRPTPQNSAHANHL